jgi:hypothetical protein
VTPKKAISSHAGLFSFDRILVVYLSSSSVFHHARGNAHVQDLANVRKGECDERVSVAFDGEIFSSVNHDADNSNALRSYIPIVVNVAPCDTYICNSRMITSDPRKNRLISIS